MEVAELFENAIEWLRIEYQRDDYETFRFSDEEDLVELVADRIKQEIEKSGLPYEVRREHLLLQYHAELQYHADLVILNRDGVVEVAAEFKYSRRGRASADPYFGKGIWDEFKEDDWRIQQYVKQGKAKVAYALFIDEAGYFHSRSLRRKVRDSQWRYPQGSKWINWGQGRWVLWAQASRD